MKKLLIKSGVLLLLFTMTIFVLVGCKKSDVDDANKIEIVVDGGGTAGNYNSSISMTPSAANPNPYNYLELLAEEWGKTSSYGSKYKIKINRNSINGNRETILSYVSTQTGPDILYQTGTTISEDMDKNYFVDVTDYLDQPNPYVEGNKKWMDLFDAQEIEASRAPNGSFYSIGIDRNVAGIIYNKQIFKDAGIDFEISTYSDFIRAMDLIVDNCPGIQPFSYVDNWYDIVLESGLYGIEMENYDVLLRNGIVDSEELCRASYLGKYKIMNGNNIDTRYQAYLSLMSKYHENKYVNLNTIGNMSVTEFLSGKIAMVSCLGKSMVQIERKGTVEVGCFGYPILTQECIDTYANSLCKVTDKGVRRGISGLGTGWWISSSAQKKGTVDACVDFLQFITAPQNNTPMVNKLGYAIPLDTVAAVESDSVSPLFKELLEVYNSDVENGFYEFHMFNSWGIMGFDCWSQFVVQSSNLFSGSTPLEVATAINSQFIKSRDNLIEQNTRSGAWVIEDWEK